MAMECASTLDPSVQSIIKSAAFLLFLPKAWAAARRSEIKVRSSSLGTAKLVTCYGLVVVSLAHLAAQLTLVPRDTVALTASALSLLASIGVGLLSTVGHQRLLRASKLLVLYLLITGFRDILSISRPVAARPNYLEQITTTVGIVRLLLLLIECTSKRDIFLPQFKALPPIETSNFFSVALFWWINSLLMKGHKRMLQDDDIPALDSPLQAKGLNQSIKQSWSNRATPETKSTLSRVLLKSHAWPFITTLIPRIFVAVFQGAQPLLIKTVIRYVESPGRDDSCYEYYLVMAAVAVYIGSAFADSQYIYRMFRLQLMVQSSLTSLVYDKTLLTAAHAADTGKATTVMSTDVTSISESPHMIHDAIGQVIELTFGLLILGDQVRWLWPVPLVIIFLCSRVSKYVAKNIRVRQRNWNEATERRIGALSSILGSMKSVKALGITESLVSYIAGLRNDELARAGEKRFMDCQYNSSANALGIFSPAITVVLFAVISQVRNVPLDTAVVFTTVAALSIVTHPANMLMTIYPRLVSVAASFERLQEFLLSAPLEDDRKVDAEGVPVSTDSGNAVTLSKVTIKGSNDKTILDGIDLKLAYGSVNVCAGPVGSGKTILGRTVIGEMPVASGSVEVASKKIGLCDQVPWVMAGTIKEVVCAFASIIDEERYRAAINACCLDQDIRELGEGDDLSIGSRGVNLSGGQKQRIALARLLYTGETTVVLDDTFAALDGTTERQVIENVLGSEGMLRKNGAAVLWITNSAQYFNLADNIILLEEGKIRQQGTAKEMSKFVDELKKFNLDKDTSVAEKAPIRKAKTQSQRDAENDLYRKTGDLSLYAFYFKSTGVVAPLAVVGTTATYAFFNTVPTYWVKFWAEQDGKNTILFTIGYVFIAFMAWAATSVHMWTTLFLLAKRSGTHVHNALTIKIFGAPLSYFVATDMGVTLNRFSQDIDFVDRQLPNSFARLATQCCKMTAQVVILSLVQNKFAMLVVPCAIVVYFVQRVYLRTSRQLRVMEIEAKAALFSGFHETIDGLMTIRAFGWQRAVEERNIKAIDSALRPLFLFRCLNRWLYLVLELIVKTIAIGMVANAVIGGKGRGTEIGVALNLVILTNATLVALVSSFTNLENSLGAVARLKTVEEFTPQEDLPQETLMPDEHWPARGELVLKNLSAGYKVDHNVLKQVNLAANAGQKLIVCGRTGSGKSTVFMSLLRMIESTGAMEVDGANILLVPRSIVRSRCFIAVPQDGVVFKQASLRFNLDPTATVGDEIIRAALKSTGLWNAVSSGPEEEDAGLLDKKLSALPPLSSGQQQLFALARAIVQKHRAAAAHPYSDNDGGYPHSSKPIVLLDELTAFMDSATETTVYDTIEKEFVAEGHTVIIVSHRIGGLLGRLRAGVDAVAVLKNGQLTVETDFEKLANVESSEEQSNSSA